jgi:enamine deaminase RidA (YjgF/YER057c/UK114 family)
VSGPGIPEPPFNASPAVLAGDWVFLGGIMATDWQTGVHPRSRTPVDFPFNEYDMQLQTHEIFRQAEVLLAAAGTDIANMVRIDQFATNWNDFRHYFPIRDVYITENRPASTAITIRSLLVPDARLIVDGIAVVPNDGITREAINNPRAPAPKAGYSMAIRFGDWIWCAGASPTDFRSRASYPGGPGHTQPDDVWVDPNFAYDSEIKNQAAYDLHKLSMYLEAADSDLYHVVKAQVYLTDCRDLPGLMQIWRETWGDKPPATTVVPIDAMLIGGSRVEINVIAVTKSGALKPQIVKSETAPMLPFNLPHAVKVGPYVFLSGVLAVDEVGIEKRARRGDPVSPYLVSIGRDELQVILEHTYAICVAAGCSLSDVVRVQIFTTEMNEVGSALGPWNETFTTAPPTLTVIGVSGPHIVPALAFVADVIAYAP